MNDVAVTSAKPADRPASETGGYRKGEEARRRILDAAIEVFGLEGYRGATTRCIAAKAGASLPALKYYFGGKEGLYLACAEEIVDRYRARMLGPITEVQDALAEDATPARARTALRQILFALAEQLIGSGEAQQWTGFVLKEMAEHGPAFAILNENVWAPGVELTARLIARARQTDEAAGLETARIEALMLISSLSAFSIARPVALRSLAWPDAKAERFQSVMAVLDRQIEAIVPA